MNDLIMQGVELMLTGMGIVFLFLLLSVYAINTMAVFVQKYLPEAPPTNAAATPVAAVQANKVTPAVTAAITAAVHQHREKHK